MDTYIKNSIKIIQIDYNYPFGIVFQLLRVPRGWLKKPQYWWLLAIQTDSASSYLTVCILGLIFDWKKERRSNGAI